MKKKTGILIIVLSGLSILGVIITQVFWMQNAYSLRKDQFHDKIQAGLKTVVNNLYSIKSSQVIELDFDHLGCKPRVELDNESADFVILDSLLRQELQCIRISKDYVYGIVKEHKDGYEMIGGITDGLNDELFQSDTRVSLSCLYSHSEPYYLVVYFLHADHIILKQMMGGFFISLVLLLIIGGSFIFIIYVSFRQKRISLIKNDFVNNMTHEFKTPISTVSLSAEMLLKDEIITNPTRAKKYVQVIYEENQRLKQQVDQVLQIAVIDKGEFKIRKRAIDIHKIIADSVSKIEIPVNGRGGVVKTHLAAKYPKIWADKMHFTNIISNLLDNANKYTPDTPIIIVRTKNVKNGIIISVEDNGIGLRSEDQKEIFRQFHRVHTGNLHDVKGFGLGLYYVKLMTEAHGGYVKLSSDWGKGSTFEVFFPFNDIVN
jgi:two-component system phosphate regulon sensor histidine kinase PhoR